jgi:hypothetical protein
MALLSKKQGGLIHQFASSHDLAVTGTKLMYETLCLLYMQRDPCLISKERIIHQFGVSLDCGIINHIIIITIIIIYQIYIIDI